MLKDRDSSAMIAVGDIERARRFYGDTLGLEAEQAADDMSVYRTGGTRLCVYVSDHAGTNEANAVVWGVGSELEAIVANLQDKGVTFERYDMPDATFDNGIHRFGDFGAAWFKDPDGNILHLNSGD